MNFVAITIRIFGRQENLMKGGVEVQVMVV